MIGGKRFAPDRFRVFAAAGLLCALTLPLVAAHAESGPLTVEMAAEVPARCGIAQGGLRGPDATPDLEQSARLTIRVRMDCNTPYALGVVASEGALTNLDARPDGSGFAFSKQYKLSIALDTDRGILRSPTCASANMIAGGSCPFAAAVAGQGFGSGDGISVDRDALLTVEWPDQSSLPNRLAQGRYRETLTLVIGPRA